MKLLIITNIFPTPETPNAGFYVYEQVKRLKKHFDVKVIVASPKNVLSRAVMKEGKTVFDGIDIYQTSYLTVPKIGALTSGWSYYYAIKGLISDIHSVFKFDLIISYWTYPEGFAAGKIAAKYHVPLIIRPRGSDINVFLKNQLLRSYIKKTLDKADKVIPVSKALHDKIRNLGLPKGKLSYLHNGIQTKEFSIMGRDECRKKLGLSHYENIVLYIGNLIETKGVNDLLKAIDWLEEHGIRNLRFLFLGKGKLERKILLKKNSLKNVLIDLAGDVPHKNLRLWLNAANVLCLPSHNEGCPNVVLEALACGTPVVAARVGGVPELVKHPDLGSLVTPHEPQKLAEALLNAFVKNWDRQKLADSVKENNWDIVVEKLKEEIGKLMPST